MASRNQAPPISQYITQTSGAFIGLMQRSAFWLWWVFFFVPFWAKGIPQPLLSGHEALNSEIFLFLQQRVHFYEKTIFPVMKLSLRICSVTAWNSLVVTFLDVWGPLVLFLIMLMETSYSCPGPRPDWRNWFLEDGRVLMTFPFSSFCKDT